MMAFGQLRVMIGSLTDKVPTYVPYRFWNKSDNTNDVTMSRTR